MQLLFSFLSSFSQTLENSSVSPQSWKRSKPQEVRSKGFSFRFCGRETHDVSLCATRLKQIHPSFPGIFSGSLIGFWNGFGCKVSLSCCSPLSISPSLCWRWLSCPRLAAPCSTATTWQSSTHLHRLVC